VVERKPEELSVVGSIPTLGTSHSPEGNAWQASLSKLVERSETTPDSYNKRMTYSKITPHLSPPPTPYHLYKKTLTFSSSPVVLWPHMWFTCTYAKDILHESVINVRIIA
jgi:hypothetical protein